MSQPRFRVSTGSILFFILGSGFFLMHWYRKRRRQNVFLESLQLKRAALPLNPEEKRFGEGTRDLVEEASWESFPASDPPGW